MNIFGHNVDRRSVALAGLDGVLFLAPLVFLSTQRDCLACGLVSRLALEPYQAVLAAGGVLLLGVALGVYNSDAAQDVRTFLRRFIVSWEFIVVAAMLALALSGAAAGLRLGWMLGLVLLGIVAVMLVQLGLHLALDWWLSRPSMKKRIIVLGDSAAAGAVREFVEGAGAKRFRHLPLPADPAGEGSPLCLSRLAERLHGEQIVVAAEDRANIPAAELLECKLNGIQVVDALDFWEREAGIVDVAKAGPEWLTFSRGLVFNPRRRLVKRAIDVTVSLAFLLFVAPLCLLVAGLIWVESPGPVFYRQERVGLNGRVFRVWKFRSMRLDAERDGAPRWASATDDRVTRVGRFIRKVRIDEIPQVINVLAGEMSFIGPRPERPFFVEQLRQAIPHYDLRHRVLPGITGWAQVNYPYGASVEDAKRKLAYDLFYLKRHDLLLDFMILLQTIRVVLFAHGGR